MFSDIQEQIQDGVDHKKKSKTQYKAAKALLQYVDIPKNARILDVGCGDGKITALLASQIPDGQVIGVDISDKILKYARDDFEDRYWNLSFIRGDAEELPYYNEFDAVVSFTALLWVANHEKALASMARSLKVGRCFINAMPCDLPKEFKDATHEVMEMEAWKPYFQNLNTESNWLDLETYAGMLKKAELEPIRIVATMRNEFCEGKVGLQRYVKQWFTYLRNLREEEGEAFLDHVTTRYLEISGQKKNEKISFGMQYLEAIARKGI